ncbi:unnamed protein product [Blepharisma stoltei]|uniref:C3H1-type domain-containing protein n=1 Tax=Blepharisma stoltei TaxID=1481888 RepID=A0AAU9JH38_9CILI|nr:unnamed protein product [Blepharisma stoltei]
MITPEPLPKEFENTFEKESKLTKKSKEQDFQVKYKTEMCKNWINGHCQFGDNCAFAHGKEELREKTLSKKECTHFAEGFCVYGDRCLFKHIVSSKRRLPVFINISMKGQMERLEYVI